MTGVDFFSFTTDALSANNAVAALLSLTAHLLTESIERMSVVVYDLVLDESHTGQYLAKKYKEMVASWTISLDRVHFVLQDNAANFVKAMHDSPSSSFGCFTHSLQTVVNDGVLAQQPVLDLLATGRTIVGHFNHSTTAYGKLQEI
uniref:MULE transposase domain-containing protein n=1 Tax=Amphimedon queenslandica TaxID=400682 RepID=A0A1X7VR67_AMPQE